MSPEQFKSAWRASDVLLLTAVGGVTVLARLLLSHALSPVFIKILTVAAWIRGSPKPALVTWPVWGYAWTVAWIPSLTWIVMLQALLGALAIVALAHRLRSSMPRQGALIAILCALAIPWHDLQVTLYPSALAGSLALLALLCLDRACSANDVTRAVVAGLLMGLAQNFRTEFVLLPLFLLACCLALRHFSILQIPSMRPLWLFTVVAFALQLPWALFYHANTGRYSLTESNFGHVMYVSLGSDPHNPWGIEAQDAAAMQAVRDAGYSFSSLSEEGNQMLRRLVLEDVKKHPLGLVGRTLQQLRNTLLAPFSWGEPALDKTDARDLDVLRQTLKARLGVGINAYKLRAYQDPELYSQATANKAARRALLYQVITVALGSLIFILGVLGMGLVVLRPALRPPTPLWCLLGAAVTYKILQDIVLFYQVNYLNNVYPLLLPFVAIGVTAIVDRLHGQTRVAHLQIAAPP
jgi:hypothetical protein